MKPFSGILGGSTDPVKELQRIADEAAEFNQQLESLLQSVTAIHKLFVSLPADSKLRTDFPIGAIGYVSQLYVMHRYGLAGVPRNEAYTKERFIEACGAIFDVIETYNTSNMKGQSNETDT